MHIFFWLAMREFDKMCFLGTHDDSFDLGTLEEPFFSNKFVALINVLSGYR
jgi:hypothetical protein